MHVLVLQDVETEPARADHSYSTSPIISARTTSVVAIEEALTGTNGSKEGRKRRVGGKEAGGHCNEVGVSDFERGRGRAGDAGWGNLEPRIYISWRHVPSIHTRDTCESATQPLDTSRDLP